MTKPKSIKSKLQSEPTPAKKKKKQKRHRQVSVESEESIINQHFKRGPKFKHDRFALLKALLEYIEKTPVPILAGFAYKQGISVDMLYGMPELARGIVICHQKKEQSIEDGALKKKFSAPMAIMSLKQLGWRDTQETRLTGREGGPIENVNLNSVEIPVDLEEAQAAYLRMIAAGNLKK